MNPRATLFALAALLPAALNTSPAAGAGRLLVPLCTGDGVVRQVSVPLGPIKLPGGDMPGCCAKGCHAGGSRKRPGCPDC
jgi:hypothetical protein